VAEYIGKQGASVPSTRMIREFCPAQQFYGFTLPRLKSLMSFSHWIEFTILWPWRFFSINQSSNSSTSGKSSVRRNLLFSSRYLK
jgi:hypothetical protein